MTTGVTFEITTLVIRTQLVVLDFILLILTKYLVKRWSDATV